MQENNIIASFTVTDITSNVVLVCNNLKSLWNFNPFKARSLCSPVMQVFPWKQSQVNGVVESMHCIQE
jgi:hypothetical protein